MKTHPKEIMVNLPAVHLFDTEDDIPALAAAVNTIIHGKSKIKCEVLGNLNGQVAGLFYLQRDLDSQALREQFMEMIEREVLMTHNSPFRTHDYCMDCDTFALMHQKGHMHCICGDDWLSDGCASQSNQAAETD